MKENDEIYNSNDFLKIWRDVSLIFSEYANQISQVDDDIIYHYTDTNGLYGITKSKKLWATSASYLNDRSEYKYGISVFIDVIKNIKNVTINKIRDEVLNELNNPEIHKNILCHDVYVCSFSQKHDMLSQWRGYANEGKGFAIGFDKQQLSCALKNYKCIYAPIVYNDIKKNVYNLISGIISHFGCHFKNNINSENKGIICQYLMGIINILAPFIKHPGFSEESEYRIVTFNFDNRLSEYIDVRLVNDTLVPYIPMNFMNSRNPIRKIIIGPCNNNENVRNSLKRLFNENNQYNKDSVKFVNSEIPFLP